MTSHRSPCLPLIRPCRPRLARIGQRFRLRGVAGLLVACAVAVVATFAVATSAAVAASSSGVLFDGSSLLAAGQIPFPYQSMIPGHVTVVPDPLGGGFNVMRLAVADSDRPYSGASNPRADFETPALFGNGSDLYASIKFMIPAGFPQLTSSGFFQIAEMYGPPHGGSPPIGIDLFPGAGGRPRVTLQRDANFGYDQPWTGPTLDAGWHTIYLHTVMAPDNTGSVQLWFDGQPQTFKNGSQTINYPTLAPGINWDGHTANILNVNQYRRAGLYPGTVVTYQAAAKVGTTLTAVQDTSTSGPSPSGPPVFLPLPSPKPVVPPLPVP